MHHFHGHPYCHDGLTSASLDLVASDAKMSPRNALPYAAPQPANGIGDFGDFINLNFSENVWVYGLEGVNQNLNWLLSNALVVSFFGMLAIVLAYRWLHMANAHLRHIGAMGPLEDQRYWMYNHSRLWPNVKKHLIYAPLRKVRHNRELGIPFTKNASVGMCTLPSRFHMIVLLLYCFSNMAYCLALDWDHPESSSVIAELRGRTGQLAALNIIPTVLFALRNNPLIHITRVSYDAYNLMHRWCARIMVIEAVLHTIAWAVNAHRAAGSAQVALSLATSTSFAWGMMTTVVFSFIFVTAAAPIAAHSPRLLRDLPSPASSTCPVWADWRLRPPRCGRPAADALRRALLCALGSRVVLEVLPHLLPEHQSKERHHQDHRRGPSWRRLPRDL